MCVENVLVTTNTAEYSFNFKMFFVFVTTKLYLLNKKADFIPSRIMNRRLNNFCDNSSTIELNFIESTKNKHN